MVLLSFARLSENESRLLPRDLPHCQSHPLTDAGLPPLHLFEHEQGDTRWLAFYRVVLFIQRTVMSLAPLLKGKLSWSRHLLETDDLARLYAGIVSGSKFLHISSVHRNPRRLLRRIKGFLRGQETHRYEVWVVDREARLAYISSSLQLPEEPLQPDEVAELARAYSCLKARRKAARSYPKPPGTVRVMSYNLHSCVGLDGRLSVERVAEVLHRYQPDFVALQELDNGTYRSQGAHQLELLKEFWPSEGAFFPLLEMRGGQYGIGFLSRIPVVEWEGSILPTSPQLVPQEPRGLLRVRVRIPESKETLELFNTHLGLTRKERLEQLGSLLDEAQAGDLEKVVLLGDFNCSPKSEEYARLCQHFSPAQSPPEKTWFGTFPLRHLDYCFVHPNLSVEQTLVPRGSLARVASDHLPLIVDLRVTSQ